MSVMKCICLWLNDHCCFIIVISSVVCGTFPLTVRMGKGLPVFTIHLMLIKRTKLAIVFIIVYEILLQVHQPRRARHMPQWL